jgi:hypothetical protein
MYRRLIPHWERPEGRFVGRQDSDFQPSGGVAAAVAELAEADAD